MSDVPSPTLWLVNPLRGDRPPLAVQAIGDPSQVAGLVLPASLAFELRLVQRCSRPAPGSDPGRRLPYAGPLELRIGARRAYCGALIDGTEIRLGLLALEELDLLIDPRSRRLRLDDGAGLELCGAPDAETLSAWPASPDVP